MVGQCRRSGGGLWYSDGAEFAAALELLRTDVGRRLGDAGRSFVERTYSDERIRSDYEAVVSDVAG
jgi:hypothetical protein